MNTLDVINEAAHVVTTVCMVLDSLAQESPTGCSTFHAFYVLLATATVSSQDYINVNPVL